MGTYQKPDPEPNEGTDHADHNYSDHGSVEFSNERADDTNRQPDARTDEGIIGKHLMWRSG